MGFLIVCRVRNPRVIDQFRATWTDTVGKPCLTHGMISSHSDGTCKPVFTQSRMNSRATTVHTVLHGLARVLWESVRANVQVSGARRRIQKKEFWAYILSSIPNLHTEFASQIRFWCFLRNLLVDLIFLMAPRRSKAPLSRIALVCAPEPSSCCSPNRNPDVGPNDSQFVSRVLPPLPVTN
jgi:hypothetical protein